MNQALMQARQSPNTQEAVVFQRSTADHNNASHDPNLTQASSQLEMTTTATLNYLKPMPEGIKPYTYVDAPPAGIPSTNTVEVPHRMTITDVRSLPALERPTLEENGAQFIFGEDAGQGMEWNWNDDDEVKSKYYAEAEAVLKKATGAAKIVIYDHTIRRPVKEGDDDDNPKNRHPVPRVHIDQSTSSVSLLAVRITC